MGQTKIDYLSHTWNPIAMRCDRVSPGCANCWHLAMAKRHAGNLSLSPELRKARGGGPFCLMDKALAEPLSWRKPRVVGVQLMGDLFHSGVPDEWITEIFDAMCSWRFQTKADERDGDESLLVDPGHTYLVLTKRPERIKDWLWWVDQHWPGDTPFNVCREFGWPKCIWLGVSVENADYMPRIATLLQTPAAVRFVSLEPLLGSVDFSFKCPPEWQPNLRRDRISWIVTGCESGPHRRPCKLEWVSSIVDQCHAAGVPVWVKQIEVGGKVVHDAGIIAAELGTTPDEIRQMPEVKR